MRCTTTHLQVIATEDSLIEVDNRRVSIPKGISVLEVKPGWNVELANGVTAYDLPANAFFFSRSNNDKEFKLLKEKLDLITSNIAQNQSVISGQLASLALDVADIKATGAKSAEVSAILSRLDEMSGGAVTVEQLNELSGQLAETRASLESLSGEVDNLSDNSVIVSQLNELSGQLSETRLNLDNLSDVVENSGTGEEYNYNVEVKTNKKIIREDGTVLPIFCKVFKFTSAGSKPMNIPTSGRIVGLSGTYRYYQTAANRYITMNLPSGTESDSTSPTLPKVYMNTINDDLKLYSNLGYPVTAIISVYYVKDVL